MPQLAPTPEPTIAPQGATPTIAAQTTVTPTPDTSGGLNTTNMPSAGAEGVTSETSKANEILINQATHNDKGWARKGILEDKKNLVLSDNLTNEQLASLGEVTFKERIADADLQKKMPELIEKVRGGDERAAEELKDILAKTFEDRQKTAPQYYIAKKEGYSTASWTNTTLSGGGANTTAKLPVGAAPGYVYRESSSSLSVGSSSSLEDLDGDRMKKSDLEESESIIGKGAKNSHSGYAESSQKFAEGVKKAEADRQRVELVEFEEQEKRNREKSEEYRREYQGELKPVDVHYLADAPGADLNILIDGNAEIEVGKIRARRREEHQIALNPKELDRNQNGQIDEREVPVVDQKAKQDEKRQNVNLNEPEDKKNKKPTSV